MRSPTIPPAATARARRTTAIIAADGAENIRPRAARLAAERRAYYDTLERAQRGTTDVTEWLLWFVGCVGRSIDAADAQLSAVQAKARFWQRADALPINERQRKVLNRILDGFEGPLTTSKWAKLAKCSQDTALRDITFLVERGLLVKNRGGGRSTNYSLAMEE